ncbi:FHA domain-containing protein [Halioxenophilus sp. WMMB6]|uniref:FHA domain-containing protein n=1 Tax=Halioxenophilus sp. WMMB6 TaxID=3073815 RepID=UPI00295EC146|nr:FHA domain-containing protein [Halioxenophilus sp. WMMB6]
MNTFFARWIAALVLCGTAFGQLQAATVAKVEIFRKGLQQQSGVAALVAKETLLINDLLIEQGDQVMVYDETTGAKIIAEVIAKDKEADLALISAKGLTGEPFTLAKAGLIVGRKVYLQLSNDNRREGTVHTLLVADSKNPLPRVRHTQQVLDNEFGAPLLNNCGELAGVSQNPKALMSSRLQPTDDNLSVVSELQTVSDFLAANGVTATIATATCLSDKERAELAEQSSQATKQELEEVEQAKADLEKQRAELEKARKELEARTKELDENLQTAGDEIKTASEDLESKNAELERQAEVLAEKEEAILKAEEERQRIEQEKANEQRKQLYIAAALGLLVVVVALIAVILIRGKKARLAAAEQEALANRQRLAMEQAKYEAAQAELAQASATFPDILLLGTDEDGNECRVKIIGKALAQAQDGQLLGRSAQKADYVINVAGVSREHLKITLVDNTVMVEDLKSFNGTAVNEQPLQPFSPTAIRANDKIRIGTVNCQVLFMD